MHSFLLDFLKNKIAFDEIAKEAYALSSRKDDKGLVALFDKGRDQWEEPAIPIACERGCNMCCTLNVDIMHYEKSGLAWALKWLSTELKMEVLEKARQKNSITAEMKEEERYHQRIMCPLNKDGECLIYEDRPLSCKAFTSIDINICEEGSKPYSDVQSKSWAAPMERKTSIELGAGFYDMENGTTYETVSTTLEKFITLNIKL